MTDTHAVSRSGAQAEQERQPTTRNGSANGATDRRPNAGAREEATLLPPVDVVEDATALTLFADLPGVPRDKLDIRVEAETLTIDGELAIAMPQGMASSHAEVQVTRYRRTFTLSKELDADQVDAELNNGVLRLRIPKARDAQRRRIDIKVH